MKAGYPIGWVPATPDYIFASLREEWRQCALSERKEAEEVERQLPALTTTVHEWREALDLVGERSRESA